MLASLAGLLLLATACNDEWKDEQYEHYLSFKAPLNDAGVSAVYVPYTRHTTNANGESVPLYGVGISNYQLPIIVSGTTNNDKDLNVKIVKSDTLSILNYERFQNRTDLYYQELPDQYVSYPSTHQVKAGENVSLFQLDFNFEGIDMSKKWVLPLEIVSTDQYQAHPRKHYAKALLRVYPFNNYSGTYSATMQKMSRQGNADNAAGGEDTRAYVVDENTVFFYAGNDIDETRTDRELYKVYAKFTPVTEDGKNGTVQFYDPTNNTELGLQVDGVATYSINDQPDEIQPYLLHRYITISGIKYTFNDYTYIPGVYQNYVVEGTLTMERKLNTQIPDDDQAIEW